MDEGSVRAEFAYDSDEENRLAHAEEVAERWAAREAGELDEGQDDSDEEATIRKDAEFYGQCAYCERIFYVGVKGHWMIREASIVKKGRRYEGLVKRTCCEQCFKETDWNGWIESTKSKAEGLPEVPFKAETDHESASGHEEEKSAKQIYDELLQKEVLANHMDNRFPGMKAYSLDEIGRIAKAHGISPGGIIELIVASKLTPLPTITPYKTYTLLEIIQAHGVVHRAEAEADVSASKPLLTVHDPRTMQERHFTKLGEVTNDDRLVLEQHSFKVKTVSLLDYQSFEAAALENGFSTDKIRPGVMVAPLDRSMVDEITRDHNDLAAQIEARGFRFPPASATYQNMMSIDHSPLPTFDFDKLYSSAMKKAIADGTFKLKQGIADGTISVAKQEEVQSDEEEKTTPNFTYRKSLYDSRGHPIEYDDANKCILSITFDISRYGEHKKTLTFDDFVTEKEAIETVEGFLSQPITKEYFNEVRDDLFDPDLKWPGVLDHYDTRGSLLTDCRFLESIDVDDEGNASIWCGS